MGTSLRCCCGSGARRCGRCNCCGSAIGRRSNSRKVGQSNSRKGSRIIGEANNQTVELGRARTRTGRRTWLTSAPRGTRAGPGPQTAPAAGAPARSRMRISAGGAAAACPCPCPAQEAQSCAELRSVLRIGIPWDPCGVALASSGTPAEPHWYPVGPLRSRTGVQWDPCGAALASRGTGGGREERAAEACGIHKSFRYGSYVAFVYGFHAMAFMCGFLMWFLYMIAASADATNADAASAGTPADAC